MKKKCLILSLFSVSLFAASAQVVEYTLKVPAEGCQGNVYINVGEPTALDEVELAFSVYPNPVIDVLNVPLQSSGKEAEVLLVDANGKLLQRQTVAATETGCQLVLTAYPAGIYFLQVVDSKKTTYKVIKN
jgi:hypothetical protein